MEKKWYKNSTLCVLSSNMCEIYYIKINILAFGEPWARAGILKVTVPRNLSETCSMRDHVLNPVKRDRQCLYKTYEFYIVLEKSMTTDIHLSANSMAVSPGLNVWGSRYQTSQTTAHDVIN